MLMQEIASWRRSVASPFIIHHSSLIIAPRHQTRCAPRGSASPSPDPLILREAFPPSVNRTFTWQLVLLGTSLLMMLASILFMPALTPTEDLRLVMIVDESVVEQPAPATDAPADDAPTPAPIPAPAATGETPAAPTPQPTATAAETAALNPDFRP